MQAKIANIRIAFPQVFTAAQFKGEGKPRFGVRILLPKGSAQLKTVNDTIAQVAKEGWPKSPNFVDSIRGNGNKFCLTDGDTSTVEGFAGHYVLSANRNESDGRPVVLGPDRAPLVEADGRIYSGAYCNAIVDIWAQVKDYPGIRCKLLGLQFVRDGEAFVGGVRISPEDFDVIDAGATADDLV